jgi:hypothetical protein
MNRQSAFWPNMPIGDFDPEEALPLLACGRYTT